MRFKKVAVDTPAAKIDDLHTPEVECISKGKAVTRMSSESR